MTEGAYVAFKLVCCFVFFATGHKHRCTDSRQGFGTGIGPGTGGRQENDRKRLSPSFALPGLTAHPRMMTFFVAVRDREAVAYAAPPCLACVAHCCWELSLCWASDPPELPQRMSPVQAAQFSEIIEYLHVRIRDLLLMSWVMNEMNDDEHRELDRQVDGLPSADAFRRLLKFAESFGEAPGEDVIVDPYEDDAILFFAATLLSQDSHIWSGGPPLAWQGAASVAAGRNSVTDLTKFASRNPVTGIKAFSSLQRKTPAAGQAITRVGRAALYFTSATVGSPVLLAIRREVTRRLSVPFSSR